MYFKKQINILLIIITLLINTQLKSKTTNDFKQTYKNNKYIQNKPYIYIKNNVLITKINQYTGNIEDVKLLKFNKENQYKNNFQISNNKNKIYTINSNIEEQKNNNKYIKKIKFNSYNKIFKKPKYLIIQLESKEKDIKYIKEIIFNKNSYDINIIYKFYNKTNKNIEFNIINELTQYININKNKIYNLKDEQNLAYFINNKEYKEYNFNKINNTQENKKLNWITMFEKYFLVTLIPSKIQRSQIFIKKDKIKNLITLGYKNKINILKKNNKIIKIKLWIGPKLINNLNYINPSLSNTIKYGKFWYITKYLFKILININKITNNLGFSIILLTLLIKIITYPINKIQHKYTRKIKKLKSKINKIKTRYRNNHIKMNNKIIELYKNQKINPINSIISILIQLPIFFSIYNIISLPIEFKYSKFILWIKDLSEPDKYRILPILMGISLYISYQSNKKKISIYTKINNILFTLMFTILSSYFSNGLIIYYIINNLMNWIQQKIIEKKYK